MPTLPITPPPSKPTAYVVDDDHAICHSLQLLLESVCMPVKACASAQAFLDEFDPDQPGCVLLDVRMPGMSGLELQEKLIADGHSIPIIFISCYVDWPMAVRAMRNGAFDFLEKPFNEQNLLDRTQEAIRISVQMREQRIKRDEAAAKLAMISGRERQVLDYLATGLRSRQIALQMGISTKTVETHRAKVMAKMGITSAVEMANILWQADFPPLARPPQ